ncbi:MAG: hydrogenobyrinic acid a,c-diamide synthase (glutamine-hydrolyzing) [Deltaproteobacteria bacterium]|nr:hydrogenobyrinic acid a,c-diamide synthase (glutamine-hydrolyzing) [Deltaproteobacteria bacterium]
MTQFLPRLVLAAMRGGAGKTTLSVAMAAAWKRQGKTVVPFKKGPDYIDSAWLSLATGYPCRNLDTFLMGPEKVRQSFLRNTRRGTALIEGNRGLYDGTDAAGSFSTAELAKLLQAPVILVVDGYKVTRTAAAWVLGCQQLDPAVDIRGVILNRVAGARHEKVLRQSIEGSCHLPILGVIPRMEDFPFPERHLGLIPPQEHVWVQKALDQSIAMGEKYLDLDGLWMTAQTASPLTGEIVEETPLIPRSSGVSRRPLIGLGKDSAFQFYYPENLEALIERGAEILEISALSARELPPLDALVIGGGFPETHSEYLAQNSTFRHSLREGIENGLPVYAECGGFMYLGESLTIGERKYPMVGAFPVAFGMEKRPQGHGYTVLEVAGENPFFRVGSRFRGHEFHYSRILAVNEEDAHFVYRVERGVGAGGQRDGLCRKNALASYTHLHALGTEEWAGAIVQKACTPKMKGSPVEEVNP